MPSGEEKKKKVLVVDDDPLIIRMYEHKLSADGYQVFLAFDGQGAVVSAKENKPDLILLDLMMPKMNGVETLKFLKKEPDTKKIPVIILTNLSDNEPYLKATEELGAKDYMVKAQTSLKELSARVALAVKKK